MQSKIVNIPPIAVTATVANLLNCALGAITGGVNLTLTQPYLIVKHVRANNKTGAAITLNLYKGATGASAGGTEWAANGFNVPANSAVDVYYGEARFDSTDFLTGNASAVGITLNIDAQLGFSG